MSVTAEVLDCPRCSSAGAIQNGRCQVCDKPVAAPLRFEDVIDELRLIAALAGVDDREGREAVVHACARAESLLMALRDQFRSDVIGVGRQT